MANPYPHSMSLTLPTAEAATTKARLLTTYALTCGGLAQLLDEAKLIVTELVENAVKAVTTHDGLPSEVGIRLLKSGQSLVVEVEDPLCEWLPETYADALTGKICDLWGVRPSSLGKIVWVWLANGENRVAIYYSGPPWPASGEPWTGAG